jgi:hypothetical protein
VLGTPKAAPEDGVDRVRPTDLLAADPGLGHTGTVKVLLVSLVPNVSVPAVAS